MSPLGWTVVGIIVVVTLATTFWVKVGPRVLVPHNGEARYSEQSWRRVSRSLVVVMSIAALMLIAMAVALLR